MLSIIVFIIILGALVFVHELGHFITARRNGIKASEFGFGFPPRILGIQFLSKVGSSGKKGRWRIIWGSKDGDDQNEKKDLAEAHEKNFWGGTVYSLNWIPLGGFVKIKGEDGSAASDEDSFSGKSAWVRIKVLAAGVVMNFVFAWALIAIVFMVGAPQALDPSSDSAANAKIQISSVSPESPAEIAGIKVGDEILKVQKDSTGREINFNSIKSVQDYTSANAGREIIFKIKRGSGIKDIKITPRAVAPEGQGLLGVTLSETAIIKYPWYQAIWEGLVTTIDIIKAIFVALVGIIGNLVMGKGVGADVSGPVGIAVLTKEVTGLGFVYILQFAALLSVNLGIINILPIPALDGGRILFVLIAKLKGRPVSQKVEQVFHSVGFLLLIALLVLITFRDVWRFVK